MKMMIRLLLTTIFFMMAITFITVYGLNNREVSKDAILNLVTTSYMLGCVKGTNSRELGTKLKRCLKDGLEHRRDISRIVR